MAIFAVQLPEDSVVGAGPNRDVMWDPCESPDFWSWELGEWVEVGPVDASCYKPDEHLSRVSAYHHKNSRYSGSAIHTIAMRNPKNRDIEKLPKRLEGPVAPSDGGVRDMMKLARGLEA